MAHRAPIVIDQSTEWTESTLAAGIDHGALTVDLAHGGFEIWQSDKPGLYQGEAQIGSVTVLLDDANFDQTLDQARAWCAEIEE